jgi:glycosyltransferase involved in cell wall biosynthesis
MKRKLSIVVPVYFNEGSLPGLFKALDEVRQSLKAMSVGLELVFVDDGSKDRSLELLRSYHKARKQVRVVKLSRNFGAVHACKAGFQYVTGDAFVMLAADLQDPPSLIPQMVQHWLDGAKFVICERISRNDPWLSKAFSAVYYFLLRLLVLPSFPKGGYDMALMERSFLPHLIHSSKNVYTHLLAYWMGYTPVVLRYHRPAREHGRSMWTFSKKYHAFLDVMLGFSITPIRVISLMGLVISLMSFAYGTGVTVNALMGKAPVAGFASLAALISFLVGLVILMLGLIGEYLWRIFEELNRRPETVIEQVY